jgi:hypothetical protein
MSGFFSRMRQYLGEMFPLPRHMLLSVLIYLSVACFATGLNDSEVSLFSVHTAIGIASVFGLFLMLRLMDELKDFDLDARLFPDRPICSGMVRAADIRIGLGFVTVALLSVNMFAGNAFWSALVLVGFAYLMFWHFFARDVLRASLPLTLVTHQPIMPLLLLHCLTLVADEQQHPWDAWDWRLLAPYVVLLWMPFLGWELSRKIRSPGNETEYVTYSRLLGPRKATCVALFVEMIPLLIAVYLYDALRPSGLYLPMMAAVYLVYVSACLRFLFDVQRPAKHLKGFAEIYMAGVLVVQIVTFGFLSKG